MADLIGQSIGRYHILEQLGEGGMAIVYKAYDTRLERDVAVKVIRVDQFAPAVLERILKRFEREAKSLARLSHPNIVSVIDYGEYQNIPYLVMVYLPGGTLKQRLGKPIPWQEAVELLIPIADALDYAHEQGLIHRDVKPSNILLTKKGQPMLTDFGIAKILETDGATALTGTGMGMGTPDYMAPEQWTGKTSPQSDIYALGVVFYEMVTGKKPYMADTPAAILLKQATEPLPRPGSYVPGLPDAVEKVLLKTLARQPEERYASMDAFEKALAGLLKNARPLPEETPGAVLQNTSLEKTDVETQAVILPAMIVDTRETIDGLPVTVPPLPVPHSSRQPTLAAQAPQSKIKNQKLAIDNRQSKIRKYWPVAAGLVLLAILLSWLGQGGIAWLNSTSTPTLTSLPTVTFTPALTLTSTQTATLTQTPTPAVTNTPKPTVTATLTLTNTATATPIPLLNCSYSMFNPPDHDQNIILTYNCSCGEYICFCTHMLSYPKSSNYIIRYPTIEKIDKKTILGFVEQYGGNCH